jgi:hypothetical protein
MFCDDIRAEDNGKHLLIGVYDDAIVIQSEFPIILPQLSFFVKLLEPISYRGKSGLIRIYFEPHGSDAEVLLEIELPRDRWTKADDPHFDPSAKYLNVNFLVKAVPFRVESPGYLRVRGYYDDDEVKLGSISVQKG